MQIKICKKKTLPTALRAVGLAAATRPDQPNGSKNRWPTILGRAGPVGRYMLVPGTTHRAMGCQNVDPGLARPNPGPGPGLARVLPGPGCAQVTPGRACAACRPGPTQLISPLCQHLFPPPMTDSSMDEPHSPCASPPHSLCISPPCELILYPSLSP